MGKKFFKIAMTIAMSVLGILPCAAQDAKSENCDSTGNVIRIRDINVGVEFSVSPRSHGLTPLFFDFDVSIPIKRMSFGVGYRYLLAPYKNNGDKTYLTSQGVVGSVGYRVFKKTNVKFRYAHSVGSQDLSYSMYELGLFGVETLPVSMGCGIRYIDSMTEGIRNYCSVFLAFKI